MSFEEILEAEYGKGKVYIDYLGKDSKNMANIRIISKDSKKEFRAEVILTENSIEKKIYFGYTKTREARIHYYKCLSKRKKGGRFMETLNNIVLTIQNYMSNYVLIIALLGAGLWFSFRLGFIQVRGFGEGMLRHPERPCQ